MVKSKLIELLRGFSPKEWRAFSAFLHSPYFNRNEQLTRFGEWLATRAPTFAEVGRTSAWKALFGDAPFDDRSLNHLMSQLLELAEGFIGQERYRADKVAARLYTLDGLSRRGLDKHYRFIADGLNDELAQSPLRDAAHFYHVYRLHDLERAHFDRQGHRRLHDSAQMAADSLDGFYLTEKLKYTCAMLNSQAVTTAPFHLHWLEEIRRALDQQTFQGEAPGIAIYFRILRLLTRDPADDDFQQLKRLLDLNTGRFEKTEMTTLYEYALNYCIRQIRKVREEYVQEALTLYQNGVETGILLTAEGRLSPWHFKNIIKLALRLRQFDWTEQFIREKNALLDEEFKTDALHYNLAELFFYTRRYDEALIHLNKVEFTDVHYNLGAKEMLAKIYYETDETEALESLLIAFDTYLRRNKIISEDVRGSYRNFTQLLRQIMQAPVARYGELKQRIENTRLLTAKNWLLEQVER
ncbi:MAG: hypothetical protein JNL02_13235 [Saprospiraceae bacterium]|nr:hypothetical protein [Saprospiraceae bacterium]